MEKKSLTKKKTKRPTAKDKKRTPKKKLIKSPKAKPVRKKPKLNKRPPKKPREGVVGLVTHYFPLVNAAAVKLKTPLSLGDPIRIKGHTTDFTQEVHSMQIDCKPIKKAKPGRKEIGLSVKSRVRRRDIIYKIYIPGRKKQKGGE